MDGADMMERGPEIRLPFQETLGFRIAEWSQGRCVLELPIKGHLINRNGHVHGGVLAALIDSACGFAGCWSPDGVGRLAFTLSLTTSFVATPTGDRLRAEARVRGGGKQTFFASADIFDGDGRLVAFGECTYRYRSAGANTRDADKA